MSQPKTGRRGLLLSASIAEGKVTISVDDVTSDQSRSGEWSHADHVTRKEFPADSLTAMDFGEKEMADLAFLLLSRLSVFADRHEL